MASSGKFNVEMIKKSTTSKHILNITESVEQHTDINRNSSNNSFKTICEKVKVNRNRPKGVQRGRGIAVLFLDPGTRRGWVVSTTNRPLYLPERPGTHCTGGWVGSRADLDVCEKSRPLPGFDPRTVQAVASRYND
jgi:hypothetical protein